MIKRIEERSGERMDPRIRQELKKFLGHINTNILNQNDREFTSQFLTDFISSRNRRSRKMLSSEYGSVLELVISLFPYHTFGVDCMDGRVLRTLMGGFIFGFGGFLRTPGGDLVELPDRDYHKSSEIDRNSRFADLFNKLFSRREEVNKPYAQILDSHINCAARKGVEKDKATKAGRNPPPDDGLMADVLRKKQIAGAMATYTKNNFPDKIVLPIQTSFNPNNGYMYMGLETSKALEMAKVFKGFTQPVLAELNRQNFIISTESLSKDKGVRDVLSSFRFDVNWEQEYLSTAKNFWANMVKLKETFIYTKIEDKLKNIYKHLQLKNENSKRELEERAMIVLANLYSGYLLNPKTPTGKKDDYPYYKHREQCVVVGEGEPGPFPIASFEISAIDEDDLPKQVKLAYGIVQDNRKNMNIHDFHSIYPNHTDFENAPVFVIMEETIRADMEDGFWKELKDIKFSELPDLDWMNMPESDFKNYLKGKGIKNEDIINRIETLRIKTSSLYKDENNGLPSLIKSGLLVVLPAFVNKNQGIQKIIPFFSNNF